MAKTVISAFDGPQVAAQFLDSAVSRGFDFHLFSIINPEPQETAVLDSLLRSVPGCSARLYRRALHEGETLLVAEIPENDVKRLIELLQAGGGSQIEAFDCVSASRAAF